MAVAGRIRKLEFGSEFLGSIALRPLFGQRKGSHRPSAIGSLVVEDHLDKFLLPRGIEQAGKLCSCPEQIGSIVIAL